MLNKASLSNAIYCLSLIFILPCFQLLSAQAGFVTESGNGVNNVNGGLAIFGNPSSTHIAIDHDDIQAKSSGLEYRLLELNFYGGDVSIGNDVFYMNRFNQRIGINTKTPDGPVDIDFGNSGSLIAGTPSGMGPGWIFFVQGTKRWDAFAHDFGFTIRQLDNGFTPDVDLTIDNFGRMGLRVTTPPIESDLHLIQWHLNDYDRMGIRLENGSSHNFWNTAIDENNDYALSYNGSLRVWISDTDGSYNRSSDQRVKKDIRPIKNILGLVRRLNPVTFKYEWDDPNDKVSWGFIAQEVEQVFPEFVSEKDNLKGLSYHSFAVLAIKAIQEQQNIIEEQKAQITLLQERLVKIEALLTRDHN